VISLSDGEVRDMANERRHVEQLETIMDRLAESVLELSDDDTLNEASERGVDAQKEADCTRAVPCFETRCISATRVGGTRPAS